ncbi:3-hydroxyisobutyrate dehydrogenase [Purpureocillium takamizusanense]|uniref:3-hydroxyisobutyrate dehydrogenase n=1 Tax=Purpureocillium takamizusanense TaxID=2060973 RepID=A0A9Q8QB70_9HYPO|nr:3-hydroxyisobutyrate dehydrogenase [Purpureocillium takamizusanense]UNI16853.1 3-hydroxyisobutyrate dehydrogenase [Purpureocillium takamizusanense]
MTVYKRTACKSIIETSPSRTASDSDSYSKISFFEPPSTIQTFSIDRQYSPALIIIIIIIIMSRILSLGIGNMGAALARTLLASNPSSPLTIWNRTADRPLVKALTAAGAHFQGDVAAAIAASDIILICVLDYDTIYSALSPLADSSSVLAGKTIVNLTNGTPRQAAAAQAWFRERGVARYFDGAVMVTPQLVGTPHAFLLFSGETEAAFRSRVASPLASVGKALYTGEDVASAATEDVAALAAMYGMFSGAFIGMGLVKRQLARAAAADTKKEGSSGSAANVKVTPSVESVMIPMLTALVPYVALIAKAVDEEAWDDDMGNPLGMQLAGVRNILQACKDEGVNGGALETLAGLMQKVVDDRGGAGGVPEVARFILE